MKRKCSYFDEICVTTAASEIPIYNLAIAGPANDENFVIMTAFQFQCYAREKLHFYTATLLLLFSNFGVSDQLFFSWSGSSSNLAFAFEFGTQVTISLSLVAAFW